MIRPYRAAHLYLWVGLFAILTVLICVALTNRQSFSVSMAETTRTTEPPWC